MDYGEHLGIRIDSTVIIPKGYKPLAGGWSAATTPGGESPDSFPVVFAPLDLRLMANGNNPFGIQTLIAG